MTEQRERRIPTTRGNPADDALRIQVLGEFRVSFGERVVEDSQWRLSKARSLVKLLALSAGHSLHREQVIEMLWPEMPQEAAANNLHQVLFSARRALSSTLPEGSAQPIPMRRQMLSLEPPGEL